MGIIIGADTNCHSNLFGEDTNKRGRDFEEFVIENALAIENVGTYNGSDHNTITFEIKTEKQEEIKSRNWDKGDWPMFTQKLKYVDFHEPETMTEKT